MRITQCPIKRKIYDLWCQAINGERYQDASLYKSKYDAHIATCHVCQENLQITIIPDQITKGES